MLEASSKKSREPSPSVANAGARALSRAVEAGDAAEVGRLVGAGAAADVPRAGGETLLMRAAAKGHADVARVLLDGGAEVNARRSDGFTPLLVAAFRGHAEVVRVLLERGADASAKTRLGAGACEWAASHGFAETAGLLKDAASSRARVGAPVESNGAAARGSAVDERRAPENGKGREVAAVRKGEVEKSRRDVVASQQDELFKSPLTSSGRELFESPSHELFAGEGARASVGARQYRVALPVALVLIAVAGVVLYAFVWRAKSPSSGQPPTAPAGGASNVVSQPAPQTQQPLTNAQPVPSVSPQDATGVSNMPVTITMPADVAPVGPNAVPGQSVVPGSSAPIIVVEGGASSSEAKTPRAGAAADGQTPDASKKGETRSDEARAGDEAARGSQGQGAEIRTAAPARPYTLPPSNSAAQPSPEPSPKKKVIQWP